MTPPAARAALALVLAAVAATPVRAQEEIIPTLIGGGLGLAAGGYVSIGIWSWKAQHGEYLYTVDDALGWEATPVLAGITVGAALGWFAPDRLRNGVYGALALGAVGTAAGALLAPRWWAPPEGRWAGGVVGGGAGILLGAAIGAVWPLDDDGDGTEDAGVPIQIRIPVGF